MSNIQDEVFIITGASSGIGESTAKELASKGAKLVLTARREGRLKKLQEDIQNSGGYRKCKNRGISYAKSNFEQWC